MAEDREHGFTTREEWQSFFHAYFQRIDEINELAFAITVGNTSFEDWLFSYKKQAQTIHELYMENNQYLKRHVSYFLDPPNDWNEEIAEPLISYLFRYCIRFQDIEVAYRLAQSLLAFYENKGNEIAVMKCYFVMITCFSSLDMVHYRDEILSLCEQGIKLYEKQYAHLTQEEKSMGLSIFDFESIAMYEFLRPAGDITQTFDTILYPAYERRMHAMHAFLKEADGSEEYNAALPYMKTCWINTFTAILVRLQRNTLSPDRVKKLYAISRKQYEDGKTTSTAAGHTINEIILRMCEYHLYGRDDADIYAYMEEKIRQLPRKRILTIEEYDEETLNEICLFSCIIHVLDISYEKRAALAKDILHHLSDFCALRPRHNYFEHAMDLTIYNYVIQLLPYCESEKELFLQILSFTVLRQTQTAIHTIMVSRLACRLIADMIAWIPEQLACAFGCAAAVIKQRHLEIIEFVRKAALLHDVGKILCSTVINMQYRKLIDIEYQTIQFHPITSAEILGAIPVLSCYQDVAKGHHKAYDGTYGYPETFDHTCSRQKLFIDLIAICDALDAATDTYGRNYAIPKSFTAVLQEFVQGKGTRYSPVIVEFLSSHTKLQQALEDILVCGRKETYRFVYELLNRTDPADAAMHSALWL